jgi:thiosulfate dehydrogenase
MAGSIRTEGTPSVQNPDYDRRPIVQAFKTSSLTLCVAFLALSAARAEKTPVTTQQLQQYDKVFMAEVRKGDLLFHGDSATAKKMGVTLSTTGMACAMCHPMASDTHPGSFPKFQSTAGKFSTLRDMINWCIEHPNQGEQIDSDSEAMKALETYISWSNSGSVLDTGKY